MSPGDTCLNCEAALAGSFCHQCGQKRIENERSIWQVLADWLRETFEADGRLVRTLIPFFFRPGRLVADYLAGRRARYMSPVRLYIFSLLVAFFTLGILVDPGALNDGGKLNVEVPEQADVTDEFNANLGGRLLDQLVRRLEEQGKKLEAMPARQAGRLLFDAFLDAAPTILTLLVPVFALLLKLLYWRHYYIDHLLFSLVQHALALCVATLAGCARLFSTHGSIELIALLFLGAHLIVGMQRVFGGAKWATGLRVVVLSIVYAVLLASGAAVSFVVAILKT